MGVPTPPTSARDMIDDVLCDTAGIILCDTHTVDTGLMFRDGGIPENMKSNLESGMRDISLGGLVVAGTRDIRHTKNEIEKARLTAAINTTTRNHSNNKDPKTSKMIKDNKTRKKHPTKKSPNKICEPTY
jgi:hypothetical protein